MGASCFGGNAGECVGDGVNVKSVVRGLLLRKVRIVTFFPQRMREEGIMSSRTLWATES